MNPSSSSNAEPVRGPVFHVVMRNIARDFASANAAESSRELGTLDREQFEAVLAKLAALDVPADSDADPRLLVKARRGSFVVRPQLGRWLVEVAGSADRAWTKLETPDVAPYLADLEIASTPAAEVVADSLPVKGTPPARTGLVLILMAVTVLALGGSAYFTFRPDPVDPDSAYLPLVPAEEAAALQTRVVGRYLAAGDDGGRALDIRADGTLTWIEFNADGSVANEVRERYTLARREGIPVLRAPALRGPIAIQAPNTLTYAREGYARQP